MTTTRRDSFFYGCSFVCFILSLRIHIFRRAKSKGSSGVKAATHGTNASYASALPKYKHVTASIHDKRPPLSSRELPPWSLHISPETQSLGVIEDGLHEERV